VTEYRYDAQGQRINTRIYRYASFSSQPSDILLLTDLERWAAEQRQDGISLTDYSYDWRGQLSEEIHYSRVNSDGFGIEKDATRVRYRYDAAGRLLEKSLPADEHWCSTFYCKQ
jgi:hypothetical protein